MVLDESILSLRVYPISFLLLFRNNSVGPVSVGEVHPHFPKLELRFNKQRETRPINTKNVRTQYFLSSTLTNGFFDSFDENETSREKTSSLSDMSTLLERTSPSDILKTRIIQGDGNKQHPVICSAEEPLTSRMISRLKQIAIGKSLPEYKTYINKVPIDLRSRDDPRTPECDTRLTKREFDQLYREWRVKLHQYENEAISNVSTRINSLDEIKVTQNECLYNFEKLEI
ncbi:SLBP family of RNA binding s [Cryptosporidium xiaoi]|uniref:SLBP family of RNA binding s n=1 Tax=Cryptosporidium xiaoi TaxID=659607 RepID=A0AAV9Y315_9CRYT